MKAEVTIPKGVDLSQYDNVDTILKNLLNTDNYPKWYNLKGLKLVVYTEEDFWRGDGDTCFAVENVNGDLVGCYEKTGEIDVVVYCKNSFYFLDYIVAYFFDDGFNDCKEVEDILMVADKHGENLRKYIDEITGNKEPICEGDFIGE